MATNSREKQSLRPSTTRKENMFRRFRCAAATAALALTIIPFNSGTAAAGAGLTEPGTYTLSPGASVDRTITNVDRTFANTAALPPPCVTAGLDTRGIVTQTIHVRNGCAVQERVKAIVAFGFDSPCFILEPGSAVAYAMDTSIPRAYFDGLEAC
jgi:hypothetical protein